MVTHKDWPEKGGSKLAGADFEGWVMDQGWWKKVDVFLSVMELFYNVMRRTDAAAKGMMGQLYDNMLQLTKELDKLLNGKECKLSRADKDKVREHLRKRWDESLACPLHVAGRILNSANQEEGIFLQDAECTKVMQEWLERQKAFVDRYWKKSGGKKGPVRPLHEGLVRDLAHVAHNWNVVHKFHKDAEAGPSVVGRKGAVVEGNIPPPPLPEGYKLEEDGEVEADEDDVCLDEWQTQEELEKDGEG
ncbi:unnamed protein product [Closterium sp. Yama58-4]|nr:unnamed protein product [Closterium sp. Yama58-4]